MLEGKNLLARHRIPHLHHAVQTATCDPFAIATEGHAHNMIGVPFEGKNFLARGRIPHLHSLVPTATNDPLAIVTDARALYNIGVPLEVECFLARCRIPYLHSACLGVVVSPGEDSLAIRTEAHAADPQGVCL